MSHIVDSFLMFWPAVTQDDYVVCCLATYSDFVLDFFFRSIIPLILFSDSTFLVSCHLSKFWNHLWVWSCFPKRFQLLPVRCHSQTLWVFSTSELLIKIPTGNGTERAGPHLKCPSYFKTNQRTALWEGFHVVMVTSNAISLGKA